MNQTVIRKESEKIQTNSKKFYKTLLVIGAVGGFAGGLMMSLFGIFLSAEVYLTKIPTHKTEVVFLIAALFLLAFGAHCLDLTEKARRLERR